MTRDQAIRIEAQRQVLERMGKGAELRELFHDWRERFPGERAMLVRALEGKWTTTEFVDDDSFAHHSLLYLARRSEDLRIMRAVVAYLIEEDAPNMVDSDRREP